MSHTVEPEASQILPVSLEDEQSLVLKDAIERGNRATFAVGNTEFVPRSLTGCKKLDRNMEIFFCLWALAVGGLILGRLWPIPDRIVGDAPRRRFRRRPIRFLGKHLRHETQQHHRGSEQRVSFHDNCFRSRERPSRGKLPPLSISIGSPPVNTQSRSSGCIARWRGPGIGQENMPGIFVIWHRVL